MERGKQRAGSYRERERFGVGGDGKGSLLIRGRRGEIKMLISGFWRRVVLGCGKSGFVQSIERKTPVGVGN